MTSHVENMLLMLHRNMEKRLTLADSSVKEVHLSGWKKDKPDVRDFRLKSVSSVLSGAKLMRPKMVDNSKKCSPVEDQKNLGSCTAQMLAGIVEYNNIRWGERVSRKQISRLFEYYATRKIMGTTEEDSGAYIRDTIKAAAVYGCVWERLWRYDISRFTENPPQKIWDAATTHKITSYHRIDDGDLETMKQTLASGYLIGFGFEVYTNFVTRKMSIEGHLHLPSSHDIVLGGHAVVLVGYDDEKKAFKVRNSWGKDWALGGYFWIDYDYVGDRNLSNDFWVINSATKV